MKYIVVKKKDNDVALESMIIFPDLLTHVQVAKGLEEGDMEIVSAGFISGCRCYGSSVSLNLFSRPVGDEELLQQLMRGW